MTTPTPRKRMFVEHSQINIHNDGSEMDADWRNLVEKCSLQNWESVLKVVASNVQDEEEFALLAGALGQRLENSDDERLRMGAFVCLLSTGDAEAVTEVWSKVKTNATENDSDFIEVLLKCVNVLKRAAEVRSKSARSLQPTVCNGVNQQHWGNNGSAGPCGPVMKRQAQYPREVIPRFARNNFNNQPAMVGHPGFPLNAIPAHVAMGCPNAAPVFGAGLPQYPTWQNTYPPRTSFPVIAGQSMFTPAMAIQPGQTFMSTPYRISEEAATATTVCRNSSSRRGFLSKLRSPDGNDSASETESHPALSPRSPTSDKSTIPSVEQEERPPKQPIGETSQDSAKQDKMADHKTQLIHNIWKVIRKYCNKDYRLESEVEDNIFDKIMARVEYWKDRFELIT